MLFPSSESLFTTINAAAAKFQNGEKIVILDFSRVPAIDSTAAESICEALSFSKTLHPDFRFELENIKEKQLRMLEVKTLKIFGFHYFSALWASVVGK